MARTDLVRLSMMTGGHLSRGIKTTLAALALLALVPGAAAQAARRQAASLHLTSARPGTSSGVLLSVDYFDPARPAGKPYAVQTVLSTLASGAAIDTSVPARCGATDAQLMLQGVSACPASTRVGGGIIDLDTGLAAQRLIKNHVTFFNADHQLVFLTESTNTPVPVRAVVRATVVGRTITATTPPIPGAPPPDTFAAVKTVRVSISSVTRAGRAYITTPPLCPHSGKWTNSVDFTYHDGVTQRVNSEQACATEDSG